MTKVAMAGTSAQDHATAYCELLKCLADIGFEAADGVLQEVPCDIDDIKPEPGRGCNKSTSNQGAKAGGDIVLVFLLLAMLMQRSRGRRKSVD